MFSWYFFLCQQSGVIQLVSLSCLMLYLVPQVNFSILMYFVVFFECVYLHEEKSTKKKICVTPASCMH